VAGARARGARPVTTSCSRPCRGFVSAWAARYDELSLATGCMVPVASYSMCNEGECCAACVC